ncbi:hypothetical protein [Agromyces bauzanensis]
MSVAVSDLRSGDFIIGADGVRRFVLAVIKLNFEDAVVRFVSDAASDQAKRAGFNGGMVSLTDEQVPLSLTVEVWRVG